VNTPEHNRLGSVGRASPGTHIRITDGGEITVCGPGVMRGYYKRMDLTRQVIDEQGWFHTGDLSEIDHDGFLGVTGRIKNIIVLGSGKKVFPEEKHFQLIQEEVRDEVQRLAPGFALYKRPSRIVVRFEEFPKTSTRKMKRALVMEWLRQFDQAEEANSENRLVQVH
jgi:long-subunit acyl-CoA synthetase (AMP-forming)